MTSWHVLVSRRTFTFAIAASQSDGVVECARYFPAVCPVVPLPTTSAACLFDGLYRHEACNHLVRLEEGLRAIPNKGCHFNFFIMESDAAGSNDKMIAHVAENIVRDNSALVANGWCANHQNSLIEGTLMCFIGLRLHLKMWYCLAAFFKGGTYWLRSVGQNKQECRRVWVARCLCLMTTRHSCIVPPRLPGLQMRAGSKNNKVPPGRRTLRADSLAGPRVV